ncbi:MAG TPA: MmgE/PrpD family protein [Nitrososphaerales archaeon]|nr:MmgE/PrpD family protein [Nitrososphaerales archaeon]
MELADRLAEYALSVEYGKLDQETVTQIKARIIDAIGCAIGASRETPVEIARETVSRLRSGGNSTILGSNSGSSPELATFVNGLMVRYFDFNDTYLSKEPAHPSDNLAPCLAVAEAERSTGSDLIAAVVVAYEIQCRLCDAADLRHRGWDHVNYGLVSSSLAASKLMGLSSREATHAVNLALSGHIAMRQVRAGELSMWKGASFANAARNAVFAAMLAREGMTGPAPIFEGEMGFFKQVSGPFNMEVEGFGGRKGRFRVNETYVKYWPAEYHAQSAIWAALDVRKRADEIGRAESILVQTHEAGYTILGKGKEKWMPRTKESADHSLPFIVGSALLDGRIDNESYSEKSLSDPSKLRFLKKIKVVEDQRFTSKYPARGMPNRVTVKEKGGRLTSAQVDYPKGHPRNPMTKDDIQRKFLALTRGYLSRKMAGDVLLRFWKLEAVKDLKELLSPLRNGQASNA